MIDAEASAPVPGGTVRLLQGELEASGESDADGAFAVEWASELAPLIEVSHPEYVDLRAPRVRLDEELLIHLQPSGSIAGTVWVEGVQPSSMEEVTLELWVGGSERSGEEPERTRAADDRGRFRIGDLTPGTYALCASTDGAPPVLESGIVVQTGRETAIELTLRSEGELRGRAVLQGTDQGIPGVAVRALIGLSGRGLRVDALARRETVTGDDGSFHLDGLGSGPVTLELRTPWGALTRVGRTPGPESGKAPAIYRFPPPANLSGRVSNARGAPLPGALVVLIPRGEVGDLPLGEPEELVASLAEDAGPALRSATADFEGRFDLGSVAAFQPLQLVAYPPGSLGEAGYAALSPKLTLRSGEARVVDLTLVAARPLGGRVIDAQGEGIGGARVEASVRLGRSWTPLAEATSDPEGHFHLASVPEVNLLLVAEKPGYRTERQRFDAAITIGELELSLVDSFVLHGAVVDREGWSIAAARVRARNAESGRSAIADEFGRFEIEGLFEGSYVVTARANGFRLPPGGEVTVSLPEAPFALLELEPVPVPVPGTVVGELALRGTGDAIAGLEILGISGASVTLDGARFRITNLPPGPKRLQARAPEVERVVFPPIDLAPGGLIDLGRYETRPTARVRVLVRDPEGRTVRGARVTLHRTDVSPAPGVFVPGKLQLSEQKGRYEHPSVGRYPWRLIVRHDRWDRHVSTVSISGRREEIEVTLQPQRKGKAKGAKKRGRKGD